MSNFSNIGFPVHDLDALYELLSEIGGHCRPLTCAEGAYLKYDDPSGAQLYLQVDGDNELVGVNPHFAGKSRRRVAITHTFSEEERALDGACYAWADPSDPNDPESGEYPFVFEMPDFRVAAPGSFPALADIQLVGFATTDLQLFDTEEKFLDSQEDGFTYAAQSFFPVGLFVDPDTSEMSPSSYGLLTGTIRAWEERVNEYSGQSFYWCWVDTLGGEIDVVADGELVETEPRVGGLIHGQFWLSGRIAETPASD